MLRGLARSTAQAWHGPKLFRVEPAQHEGGPYRAWVLASARELARHGLIITWSARHE